MEQKQRRNLAISILGLGVVALVVDQVVLQPGDSGPSVASADEVLQEATPAPVKAAAARHSLALRLRQAAGELDRRTQDPTFLGPPAPPDAFAGPVAWRADAPLPVAEESGVEKVAVDPSAPALTLTSMFNGTHAVISGKTLKVGGSHTYVSENKVRHDVTLISLDKDERQAVVRVNGREFTLTVGSALTAPR